MERCQHSDDLFSHSQYPWFPNCGSYSNPKDQSPRPSPPPKKKLQLQITIEF